MISKKVFTAQPYLVGPNKTSLALIIPAKLTRECGIDSSTIFAIQHDANRNSIFFRILDTKYEEKKDIEFPADEGLQSLNQQEFLRTK